jgi:hypothetical protein
MPSYLFGQMIDPSIKQLTPYFDYLIDQESEIYWNMDENLLYVNGEFVNNIESIFFRYNVFSENNYIKYNNFTILKQYVMCNDKIKTYNKQYSYEKPYKLYNIMMAKKVGLDVPYTEITKQSNNDGTIIKPVLGGQHTQDGNEIAVTSIIQQKIVGKNKRLYIVNDKHFCFEIVTDKLDYRDDVESKVIETEIDPVVVEKTKRLVHLLNLNFTASDFMEDDNKIWYLETNTGPMFNAFDDVVKGELSKTIRRELENI